MKRDDLSFTSEYILEQGIVILYGTIDDALAQATVAQLQYLDSKYPGRPIQLWLNSGGGQITSGMAIYDTMNYIKSEVHTVAIGMAASMAAFLLSSGTKGKRFALPNTEVLIHQPLGGAQGQATDIINEAKHIERIRDKMNEIMAKNCHQSKERVEQDTDRDHWMTAQEALEYGLIDQIIETVPKAW